MKKLMTAAEAAGYAMAPYEEYFHSPDDAILADAVETVGVAEIEKPVAHTGLIARAVVAETWLKGVFGGYISRRAPA
jgi:hypothetical protein